MAHVLHTFKHLSVISARGALKILIQPALQNAHLRTLYSATTLGIDTYIQQRARTDVQLGNILERFRTKMEEYTADESQNMIFTEDLKNMIHLATEKDVNLIMKMMYKFNEQNKQLRFGSFVFGPVVMRMLHYLNKPQEAIECFTSPRLEGFFDQLITYQVLLDLLYENKMYKEVLVMFENIESRQIEGTKYPRNTIALTLAACYKLNTPDSCKYALNLWNNMQNAGHFPMRRAATFCAALMLNQNQPETCLEILSTTKNQNYTTIRNLKVLALARIGRLDDAVNLLKNLLELENIVKQTYNKDVLAEVEAAVEKGGNADLLQEMNRIQKYFAEQGHISDETLQQQLCEEIKTPAFLGQNRYGAQRYKSQQSNIRYNKYQPRKGLTDIN